jgi:hypothetical protein
LEGAVAERTTLVVAGFDFAGRNSTVGLIAGFAASVVGVAIGEAAMAGCAACAGLEFAARLAEGAALAWRELLEAATELLEAFTSASVSPVAVPTETPIETQRTGRMIRESENGEAAGKLDPDTKATWGDSKRVDMLLQ